MRTTTSSSSVTCLVSGMRATGLLHLGHYHGVIKNWLTLQHQYDCYFEVADWHALTTQYENPSAIHQNAIDVAIDWLACGVSPSSSHIFIQSQVPEIAELHLLLSMITPVSWLERVPTYKEQQEKLKELDLSTYGFLGYPLLQAADILFARAHFVPVGEDQLPHIEFVREVARRFNFLYGREKGFEQKAEQAIDKLGKKNAKLYRDLKKLYQETGDTDALEKGRALVDSHKNISISDKEWLFGYIEGAGKIILPEPEAVLTENSKLVGLDGQKMSKSYNNTIKLRESNEEIEKKIKVMPTDPKRVRRSDPGDPEKCPVWSLHKVYSNEEVKAWANQGCRTAGIGCLDCKKPLIQAIQEEVAPIRERAKEYTENLPWVKTVLAEGAECAREAAKATLTEVKSVLGLEE